MKGISTSDLPAAISFTTVTTKRLVVTGTATVSQSVKDAILTNKNWQVLADGTRLWGPGDFTYDLNLYRHASGTQRYLRTDNGAVVGGELWLDFNATGKKLFFGSAGDANLYRTTTATLKTDGVLISDPRTSVASVTTARTGGAAAALPANPVRYLAMQDENGNRVYVPAYS